MESSNVITAKNCPLTVPHCCSAIAGCTLLFCLALQEKVLTPLQVSGLESLLVPPLAAAWQAVTSSQQHAPIAFGAQLSAALRRAAAAAEAAAGRVGRGTCPAGQQGLLLQQALQQQKAAADRQYLLLLTGKKQLVSVLCWLHSAGLPLQAWRESAELKSCPC